MILFSLAVVIGTSRRRKVTKKNIQIYAAVLNFFPACINNCVTSWSENFDSTFTFDNHRYVSFQNFTAYWVIFNVPAFHRQRHVSVDNGKCPHCPEPAAATEHNWYFRRFIQIFRELFFWTEKLNSRSELQKWILITESAANCDEMRDLAKCHLHAKPSLAPGSVDKFCIWVEWEWIVGLAEICQIVCFCLFPTHTFRRKRRFVDDSCEIQCFPSKIIMKNFF